MTKWDVQFVFLCIWTGLAVFRIGDQFLMNNARLRGRRHRITGVAWEMMLLFGSFVLGVIALLFGIGVLIAHFV